jgi:octaheme c-type cytochrome (tetrathionate reductase family)
MTNLIRGAGRLAALLSAAVLAFGIAGCEGDDGKDGAPGPAGPAGSSGSDGVNCWDLNQNGIADLPDEDINRDGVVNAEDCRAPGGAYDPVGLHKGYFTENTYEGTKDCLACHGKIGDDILTTGHWNWQGLAEGLTGFEGEIHGKTDIINNFCVAVPSNEGRCTQCHIGYGWKDDGYDFKDPKNIDCLVCHDQTGTYTKSPSAGGGGGPPDASVDLQKVAQSVGESAVPTRKACLFCHAGAGGGDNVKHGDLTILQADTTCEYDVHMGSDVPGVCEGKNMSCVDCHDMKRDADGKAISHGIGGMPYHSVDEGAMKRCEDCHGSAAGIHAGTNVANVIESHTTLACQVCHIPAISRQKATKVEWYWEDAGQDISPIPVDPETGEKLYDKMKGTFVWKKNVRPELRYYDGKWDKALIGVNDEFDATDERANPTGGQKIPAVLAAPTADRNTAGAKIYTFKKMIGNQPAARIGPNRWKFVVPHLFGPNGKNGPNAYWSKYDWDLALQDGYNYLIAKYQPFVYQSGEYGFPDTEMMLSVNHEVAPAQNALGKNGCTDCHGYDYIDWKALGCTGDPISPSFGTCP